MADAEELPQFVEKKRGFLPRRKRWRFVLALLILLLVTSLLSWRSRVDIVENLVESQLGQLGLDASYEIESITATRQVLRNFVIGDPARPDLTIERIELVPRIGLTGPTIGTLRLVRPRLRATYRDGQLSMGALDPLLQSDSEEPVSLPDWNLELVGARARVFTGFGVIGLAADGQGRLSDGFAGQIGAVAPDLALESCAIGEAALAGKLAIVDGKPGFTGPLKFAALDCGNAGISLDEANIDAQLIWDRDWAGLSGTLKLATGKTQMAATGAQAISGSAEFDWRDGLGNAKFSARGREAGSAGLTMATLGATGAVRLKPADSRFEIDAEIEGRDIAFDAGVERGLAELTGSSAGTLAEPLLVKLRGALSRALPQSTLSGQVLVRQNGERLSVVVPSARLRSAAGDELVSVSQLQYANGSDEGVQLAGNFATSGDGLPQMRGRIEQSATGGANVRFEMAPYRAGTSSLAIPRLTLSELGKGSYALSGMAIASGEVPGGRIAGLQVPLDGTWSERSGLAMVRNCHELRFKRFEISGLDLATNSISLCPYRAASGLQSTADGLAFSLVSDDLALGGTLGDSSIALEAKAVRFTSSEGLVGEDALVTLGQDDDPSRIALKGFTASFAETVTGSMTGLEAGLAAVPLDIAAGEGAWRFSDGVFEIADARFDLLDRAKDERFERLTARGAMLAFEDNRIFAKAALRHPDSDRLIVEADIAHDLSSGIGSADLLVPGIVFDNQLEPSARIDQCDESISRASGPTGLTCLATGVIALADGVISGSGRIDWNEEEVTSSGTFQTNDFDFAAAFGPVQGVSGEVRFSDLLSLTTDGTQSLKIASINPGVEVFEGVFDFALRDGTRVSIKGGRWPFFGGTMLLRPTELDLAVSEQRSYVIEITGADAAQFVTAMEMGNLSVTGTFDGAVPLVFDEMGNGQIISGLLISRPPGGNVSYVGELTYEDAGAIANFAFDSLRSLDFSQMSVEMNGPLSGEIITRLLFDGISQGEGASRNFVTRQIAKLPIRFNVNIRASFYELLTDLRSMYDPAFIRDPRSLGLLRTEDGKLVRPTYPQAQEPNTQEISPDESSIQPDESEILP